VAISSQSSVFSILDKSSKLGSSNSIINESISSFISSLVVGVSFSETLMFFKRSRSNQAFFKSHKSI
jgi:hypothetical protein